MCTQVLLASQDIRQDLECLSMTGREVARQVAAHCTEQAQVILKVSSLWLQMSGGRHADRPARVWTSWLPRPIRQVWNGAAGVATLLVSCMCCSAEWLRLLSCIQLGHHFRQRHNFIQHHWDCLVVQPCPQEAGSVHELGHGSSRLFACECR
jgi:hypothetical protein